MSLYTDVLAERFGPPVRTDRPFQSAPGAVEAMLAELYRQPLYLDRDCMYAACDRTATGRVDGWSFCGRHMNAHIRDAA